MKKNDSTAYKSPDEVIRQRKKYLLDKLYVFDFIKKIIFLIIVLYFILNYIFGILIVPNNDMSPRLSPSDLVIYYRLDKKFVADDVIVFNQEGKDLVYRVVATEGDEVNITESGLQINGSYQANTDIYFKTGVYEDGIKFPVKLKKDEVFVLGDLREGAIDSRYFGPVKAKDIKGKIFILLRRTKF